MTDDIVLRLAASKVLTRPDNAYIRNFLPTGLGQSGELTSTAGNPFLLPGIRLRTSPTYYFPIRQVYLYRYDNKQWVRASRLLTARG